MASQYLRVLTQRKGWEVSGIVSRTLESAKKIANEHQIFQIFPTVCEMYGEARPDVVIVAVPELETFGLMQQIWEHPWVSLVEKPVGYNLGQAKLLADQCRALRRTSFVALNRRFYESSQTARKILSEDPGTRYVAAVDQHDTEVALSAGQPAEVVSNWHFANAIHTVDLIRQFARGTVVSVDSKIWEGEQGNRFVDARIVFDSGDIATYQSYWNMPQNWSVSCSTRNVRVLLSPLEQSHFQRKNERILSQMPLTGLDQKFKPGLDGLLSELEAHLFGEESALPSLDEALESMILLEQIYGPPQ